MYIRMYIIYVCTITNNIYKLIHRIVLLKYILFFHYIRVINDHRVMLT